jgi:3-hydroxyacyl-CoA dehydrogenase
MVPEISDRIVEIDRAMRWGYGQHLGPFELWDALGFEPTARRIEAEGRALPDNVQPHAVERGQILLSRRRPRRPAAHRIFRSSPPASLQHHRTAPRHHRARRSETRARRRRFQPRRVADRSRRRRCLLRIPQQDEFRRRRRHFENAARRPGRTRNEFRRHGDRQSGRERSPPAPI